MENIIELSVSFALSHRFRILAEEKGCKVQNVVERVSNKVITFILDCPKENESLVCDYAFTTFIKNPVFQKYYHETSEFQEIAANYIFANTVVRYVILGENGLMAWDNQTKCLFPVMDYNSYIAYINSDLSEKSFLAQSYTLQDANAYIEAAKKEGVNCLIFPINLQNVMQ